LTPRAVATVVVFAVVAAAAPASAQQAQWAAMPRMDLQAQYAGPLRDTIIQRWRDPKYGTICYLYLPILVEHSPPAENGGYVTYGANTLGSISCLPMADVPVPEPRPQGR
jgi:hypothetical protein